MKYKIIVFLFGIFFSAIQNAHTQSIFNTKEEVAEFLEGEWNLDVVQGGFAGGTYYLPTPLWYDSTVHKIVFEITQIDSTPLLCKAYIEDTLYQERFVTITENPSQIILPRWQLFNVTNNLETNVDFMEEIGFYGFAQDTITLSGYVAADGFQFGLSRISTNTNIPDLDINLSVYPNPSNGHLFIKGIKNNTAYELYGCNGSLVQSGKISDNKLEIKEQGIFFIKLSINGRWYSKKIIVTK